MVICNFRLTEERQPHRINACRLNLDSELRLGSNSGEVEEPQLNSELVVRVGGNRDSEAISAIDCKVVETRPEIEIRDDFARNIVCRTATEAWKGNIVSKRASRCRRINRKINDISEYETAVGLCS